MEQAEISNVVTGAVLTILTVAGPMLLIGLVMGLVISVLQATTQINEQTIVFVVKILSVFLTLIIFGPWMLTRLSEFTMGIFEKIAGG
ncbi:MAG: flagellar biosynthesis protein FliQ [Oscillospiraceae bacterium]|nr:flagellar biosynthesis protein FliQ [Oscillospiraceae bacterium]